jgi:hypothetical protein
MPAREVFATGRLSPVKPGAVPGRHADLTPAGRRLFGPTVAH